MFVVCCLLFLFCDLQLVVCRSFVGVYWLLFVDTLFVACCLVCFRCTCVLCMVCLVLSFIIRFVVVVCCVLFVVCSSGECC